RLLTAVCSQEIVLRSTDPTATSSDVHRCEKHLQTLLGNFPREYSAIVVTDDQGITRCASNPEAVGVNLADREIFRQVRDHEGISIGPSVASRVTPRTIIPIATSVHAEGSFRGMCAIGISLNSFADFVTVVKLGSPVSAALVDGAGIALGGSPQSA